MNGFIQKSCESTPYTFRLAYVNAFGMFQLTSLHGLKIPPQQHFHGPIFSNKKGGNSAIAEQEKSTNLKSEKNQAVGFFWDGTNDGTEEPN